MEKEPKKTVNFRMKLSLINELKEAAHRNHRTFTGEVEARCENTKADPEDTK